MEINKIYNEDCIDTMRKMPDECIDLVVTSPPYNMRTRIRNGQYSTREKGEHFSVKYKYFDDAMPIEEFYNFHSNVMNELLRVSKIICYNIQIVSGSKEAFFKMIGDFSNYIKDIIIWDKKNGQPAMGERVLNSCYELILILESNGICGRTIQNARFNRGTMDNILRLGRGKRTNDIHAACFPIKMPNLLINAFSDVENIIYDPFMGSGTTAIAALMNNRQYLGSEISKTYCDMANKRISAYSQQYRLFS